MAPSRVPTLSLTAPTSSTNESQAYSLYYSTSRWCSGSHAGLRSRSARVRVQLPPWTPILCLDDAFDASLGPNLVERSIASSNLTLSPRPPTQGAIAQRPGHQIVDLDMGVRFPRSGMRLDWMRQPPDTRFQVGSIPAIPTLHIKSLRIRVRRGRMRPFEVPVGESPSLVRHWVLIPAFEG